MKRILLFLLLIYSISFSQVYMNIKNKDGTTQSYSIKEIKKLTFSNVVSVENGKLLANTIKSFSLLQNYPNPFNPSTTIEYQIPKAGNVEVKIYNITGELVKTINNGFQNSGSYKVNWNSKNDFGQRVASGIYLFQVKYENIFLTKKLMLLK
jgi:glucan phosphoethanolaminetransferase (alkaline phosphatase superfamily)